MRRKLLLVALALGTVGGYGAAIASHRHRAWHREAWKQEVADVCVAAVQRRLDGGARHDQ